ncbi:hypothetical protein MMC07_001690 [Pseudocyphellaria aurata]|nr:hypothetical protein [Pseudocyphellaria aurata]
MSRRTRQINQDALVAITWEYPTIHPSIVRTVFELNNYDTAATCDALERPLNACTSWLEDAQPPPYDSSPTAVPRGGHHSLSIDRHPPSQQPQRRTLPGPRSAVSTVKSTIQGT